MRRELLSELRGEHEIGDDGVRKYFLEDPLHPKGGIVIECKDDHDCVFCERCMDVFWDYTNLIYMIACADDHDPWERPCKYFKEGEANEIDRCGCT